MRHAAQAASAELAAQEELELTLSPETDSDLDDVGIDLGAPAVADDVALPPLEVAPVAEAPDEEEFDIIVDDASEVDLSL